MFFFSFFSFLVFLSPHLFAPFFAPRSKLADGSLPSFFPAPLGWHTQEQAIEAQLLALKKTPGLGSRIDIELTLVRIGFFFGDHKLITTHLAQAEKCVPLPRVPYLTLTPAFSA